MQTKQQSLLTIMGPTASGKTALSIQCAKVLQGEIISADALQVYRTLDIGTAKICDDEKEGIPHHLIDIKEPDEHYTVAEFCKLAREKIAEIADRGRLPILVGGTGLYVQALLEGYEFSSVGPQEELVQHYEKLYAEKGLNGLIEEMKELSPAYFLTRKVVDRQRLIRALSVLCVGSHYQTTKKSHESLYQGPVIALVPPREVLYERINERVAHMIQEGLEEEAKTLFCHYGTEIQAGRGIGYKEWLPYLQGEQSKTQVISEIAKNTRRFAKRQLTWLKRMPYIKYYDPTTVSIKEMIREITEALEGE